MALGQSAKDRRAVPCRAGTALGQRAPCDDRRIDRCPLSRANPLGCVAGPGGEETSALNQPAILALEPRAEVTGEDVLGRGHGVPFFGANFFASAVSDFTSTGTPC